MRACVLARGRVYVCERVQILTNSCNRKEDKIDATVLIETHKRLKRTLILMGQDKRWAQFRVKPFSFPSNRLTGKTMINGEEEKKKKKRRKLSACPVSFGCWCWRVSGSVTPLDTTDIDWETTVRRHCWCVWTQAAWSLTERSDCSRHLDAQNTDTGCTPQEHH